MRLLVTLLIAAGVITLHVLDNPSRAAAWWREATHKGQEAMDVKEVRVEGLRILSRTEIERVLPQDESAVWWQLHATDVQANIEKNPWVADASVGPCPGGMMKGWGCYVVSVKEKVPTFVASIDNVEWIIDDEGSFITTRADAVARGVSVPLIGVRGLASRSHSPDSVRGQLTSAAHLVPELQRSVGRRPQTLEFLSHGDFSVRFESLPFPVIFASGRDAKVSLMEQGTRLAELLKKVHDRVSEIDQIDLAFDRVGVIKFRPAAPETSESSSPEQPERQ